MGRWTYWHAADAAVPSPPLGDANRGMCPWPCTPRCATVGRPAALTPPSGGLFRFHLPAGDGSPAAPARVVTTLTGGGQTAGPRLAQGLLRRRRAGSRDRGAGTRAP